MPAWFLNTALTRFRNEVNSRWPRRDKTSDGTIGDAAHQATNSSHNPDPDGSVDAWDMDVDGVPVATVIAAALKHESIQYVIYNRRITSRSWGLGTWRTYTGASPHTEHVHFNTRSSHENSSKPWFTDQQQLREDDDMSDYGFEAASGFRLNSVYGDVRNGVLPAVADLKAAAQADVVRDNANTVAINALAAAITAGGGSVEAAPIIAAVQAVGDEARAKFGELETDLAAVRAELAAERERTASLNEALAAAHAAAG